MYDTLGSLNALSHDMINFEEMYEINNFKATTNYAKQIPLTSSLCRSSRGQSGDCYEHAPYKNVFEQMWQH